MAIIPGMANYSTSSGSINNQQFNPSNNRSQQTQVLSPQTPFINPKSEVKMLLDEVKFDHWIKHNFNVLLRGRRGCGKTAMVIDAFNRNNLKWQYFSTATLDPFVDFVGVPKEHTDPKTGETYLRNVMPEIWKDDQIEAIFLDEFNRSHPKVRNAALELIQFKSINGRKFKNLRVVWAAINPKLAEGEEGDEYDVEELDPAQVDRFHVQIDVPYEANKKWFQSKYGSNGVAAVNWWNGLDKKIKSIVSPRRLEYALEMFNAEGDMNDVLPDGVNISDLANQLVNGSYVERLEALRKPGVTDDAKRAEFMNENFYTAVISTVSASPEMLHEFSPFFPAEKLNSLLVMNGAFRAQVLADSDLAANFTENMQDIINSGSGPRAVLVELNAHIKKSVIANPMETLSNNFNSAMIQGKIESSDQTTLTGLQEVLNAIDLKKLTVEELESVYNINTIIGMRTGGANFLPQTVTAFKKFATEFKNRNMNMNEIHERVIGNSNVTDVDMIEKLNARLESHNILNV